MKNKNYITNKRVNSVKSIFSYLVKEFNYVRIDPTYDDTDDIPKILFIYKKQESFICIILHMRFTTNSVWYVNILMGVSGNDKITCPTFPDPEFFSKAFYLDDLIEFRTQGTRKHVDKKGEDKIEINLSKYLKVCSNELRIFGSDFLKGNFSDLESISIINKNKLKDRINRSK